MAEIRQHILASQTRHNRYGDIRKRSMKFQAGDNVLLKVSPTKRVVRFGTKGARDILVLFRLWHNLMVGLLIEVNRLDEGCG